MMVELLPFFLVLFAGLFFSVVFNRLHLPWVVALMVAGIIIGPSVLDVYVETETISILSQIGLVFLMFIAGLETRLSDFQGHKKRTIVGIAAVNGLVPFLAGLAVASYFGLSGTAMILVGIILISSSIAVVIPALESNGLLHSSVGKTIVSTTMLQDIASLVLLSLLLQSIEVQTTLPLPIFYIALFLILILLRWLVPKIIFLFEKEEKGENALFQQEIRAVFALLLGVVILFEALGLHAIIGGFFAGFVLSETITSDILKEKLHTLAYGIFIPIFFIVIGARTDLAGIFDSSGALLFTVAIILVSVVAKFASGYLSARFFHFSQRASALIGVTSMPQLSTTVAVAFTGAELGFIPANLVSSLVVLSIVTTFLAPILVSNMISTPQKRHSLS